MRTVDKTGMRLVTLILVSKQFLKKYPVIIIIFLYVLRLLNNQTLQCQRQQLPQPVTV